VLPALPPSRAHVVASKALVLLACVGVLALTVSYAHLNGLYALEARRSGLNLRMLAWTFDRAGILWCWPICTAFALAGLGAPALARDRAVGFAVAIGVPGVVAFACWGFGFGLEWSAAIAVLACAWLAWIARRAVAGAEVGDIGRILWRRHGGNVSAHRSGDAAGAGHVMRTLLRKDARAVAPVVAAALVLVLGFAAFALALPAFGERVMQQFGIRSGDPILHRLQADGLIDERWGHSETGRTRKYYQLSAQAHPLMNADRRPWRTVQAIFDRLWAMEIAPGAAAQSPTVSVPAV
jgi:hypothetical protein